MDLPLGGFLLRGERSPIDVGLAVYFAKYAEAASLPEELPVDACVEPLAGVLVLLLLLPPPSLPQPAPAAARAAIEATHAKERLLFTTFSLLCDPTAPERPNKVIVYFTG